MSRTLKVLIADDDVDFVYALKRVLEQEGLQIVEAYTDKEVMVKILEEKPDLLLLDIMMPTETEGLHIVWSIRSSDDPEIRDLPIFVISALHSTTPLRIYPSERDSTYREGEYLPVQAFYDKPIDMEKLLRDIKKFFEKT